MSPGEFLFRVGRVVSTRVEWVRHQYNIGGTRVPELKAAHSLFDESHELQKFAFLKSIAEHTSAGHSVGAKDVVMSSNVRTEKPVQLFYQQPVITHTDINWSADPKTGLVAPQTFGKLINYRDDKLVGDIKYLWELGRHQFLIPLTIDIYTTGDKDSEQTLSLYLQTWLEQNPVDTGIHWCSGLEVALRLIAWSFVHSILLAAGKKNGIFDLVRDEQALRKSIYCQINFIQSHYSRYSSANNHLIGELMGVWVACNVFEYSGNTHKWRDNAQSELEREATMQNHSDGVNREQAIYYHLWVLEYLYLAWLIGQRFDRPFSQSFVDTIGHMAGFAQNMRASNGSPANIGDADGGQVARFNHEVGDNPYADLLETIVACSNSPALNPTHYSKAFWYGSIINQDLNKPNIELMSRMAAPKTLPIQFTEGGFCLLGDAKVKICLKAGPMGYLSTAAHGHADLLSVCMSVDDQWWLTDQGTFSYHSDAQWRDYFRGTCSHNTVEIASENQSKIGGAFLWLEKATASMSPLVTGPVQSVTAYLNSATSADVNHSRAVEYEHATQTLSICDELNTDESKPPKTIKIRFHFHPLVDLEKINDHSFVAQIQGREEKLDVKLSKELSWELLSGQMKPTIEGWYSDGYDRKVPSSVLVGTAQLSTSKQFHSSIAAA